MPYTPPARTSVDFALTATTPSRTANFDLGSAGGAVDASVNITGVFGSGSVASVAASTPVAVVSLTGVSGAGTAGGLADPYYANVSLHLPMTGAQGSNVFFDIGPSKLAPTSNNNVTITQGTGPFGAGSYGDFSTTTPTDYLAYNAQTGFSLGSGDFTIETWVFLDSTQVFYHTIYASYNNSVLGNPNVAIDSSNRLVWIHSSGTQYTSSGTVPIGVWTHIAFCRVSGFLRAFINGSLAGTSLSDGTSYGVSAGRPYIGASGISADANYYLKGKLSDFRITKGVGRYAASFPVPTEPLYSKGPSGGANVTITGVSGSGSVGTALADGGAGAVDGNATVTGVAGSAGVGSVTTSTTSNATIAITGAAGTSAAGTTSAAGSNPNASVGITGVAGTAAVGTAAARADVTKAVTGVAGTGSAGTVAGKADRAVSITGVAGTGSVGTTDETVAKAITGVFGTGSAGTVSARADRAVTITGVTSTGSVGTTTQTGSATKALTGTSGTGSAGTTTNTGSANYTLTGVAGASGVGTVSASGGANPNANVSIGGVSATGSAGTITGSASVVKAITGTSGTGSAGTVGKAVAEPITGVSGTGSAGTTIARGNATVTISGVAGAAQAAEVAAAALVNAIKTISGVSATGQVGTPIASATNLTLTWQQYKDAIAALTTVNELAAMAALQEFTVTVKSVDLRHTGLDTTLSSFTPEKEVTCTTLQ